MGGRGSGFYPAGRGKNLRKLKVDRGGDPRETPYLIREETEKRFDELSARLVELAPYATRGPAHPDYDEEKRNEYYEVLNERQKVSAELRKQYEAAHEYLMSQSGKRDEDLERVRREITSSTYKRAQKRMNRDVNNWFGRGMNKK